MSWEIDFSELIDFSDRSDSSMPTPGAIKAVLREHGKDLDGKLPKTTNSEEGDQSQISTTNIGSLLMGVPTYKDASTTMQQQQYLLDSALGAAAAHPDTGGGLGGGFDQLIPEGLQAKVTANRGTPFAESTLGGAIKSTTGMLLGQGGPSASAGEVSKEGYVYPLAAPPRVGSPYGMRNGRMHSGLDLSCTTGTIVMATKAGKVSHHWEGAVGTVGKGCGRYLKIDHGDGTGSGYCHLSAYSTADGASVPQGAQIALSGGAPGSIGSGRTTGAHLHFIVYVNGKSVNPAPFLGIENTKGAG